MQGPGAVYWVTFVLFQEQNAVKVKVMILVHRFTCYLLYRSEEKLLPFTRGGFFERNYGRRPQVNLRSRAPVPGRHWSGCTTRQIVFEHRALDLRLTWGLLPHSPFKKPTSGDPTFFRRRWYANKDDMNLGYYLLTRHFYSAHTYIQTALCTYTEPVWEASLCNFIQIYAYKWKKIYFKQVFTGQETSLVYQKEKGFAADTKH